MTDDARAVLAAIAQEVGDLFYEFDDPQAGEAIVARHIDAALAAERERAATHSDAYVTEAYISLRSRFDTLHRQYTELQATLEELQTVQAVQAASHAWSLELEAKLAACEQERDDWQRKAVQEALLRGEEAS